jgi:hypothetical protein
MLGNIGCAHMGCSRTVLRLMTHFNASTVSGHQLLDISCCGENPDCHFCLDYLPFLKLWVHFNADALPTRCRTSANLGKTLLRTVVLELLIHINADTLPIRCWTSANLGKTLLRTTFLRLLVSFDVDALPPPVLGLVLRKTLVTRDSSVISVDSMASTGASVATSQVISPSG